MSSSKTGSGGDGIVGAMQSMKSIMEGKDSKQGKGSGGGDFPKPPTGFTGIPTVRIRNNKPKNVKSKQKKKTEKELKPQDAVVSELYRNLTNKSKILPPGAPRNLSTMKSGSGMKNSKDGKMKRRGPPSDSSGSSGSSRSSGSSKGSGSSGSSGSSVSSGMSGSSNSSGLSGSSVSSGAFKLRRGLEKKKRNEELMQEKVEMLTRITNLSKNGFSTTKKWTMKDDIDEIRYECYRLQRESNTKKSIKMMRQVLVSITTMVEMGNAYFNPFNLRLDGFSKNMMLSLSDYDDCFDQLHHKYSGRSSVGPEMQIMFTFLSAAVFHHAGNAINQKEEPAKKSSSSPMSSMMGMMGMLGGLGGGVGGSGNTMPKPSNTPTPHFDAAKETSGDEEGEDGSSTEKPKRRKMKGPGMASIPTGMMSSVAPPASSVTSTMPSMKIPTL